jgi:hypothetical protein
LALQLKFNFLRLGKLKMLSFKSTFLVLVVFLTGCASQPEFIPPRVTEAANMPVVCSTKEECDAMWAKAQIFIVQNAGYKIQVATDYIIETYSSRVSNGYSMRLIKTPLGEGKFQFNLSASCGDYPGICGNPIYLQARFRQDVMGVSLR